MFVYEGSVWVRQCGRVAHGDACGVVKFGVFVGKAQEIFAVVNKGKAVTVSRAVAVNLVVGRALFGFVFVVAEREVTGHAFVGVIGLVQTGGERFFGVGITSGDAEVVAGTENIRRVKTSVKRDAAVGAETRAEANVAESAFVNGDDEVNFVFGVGDALHFNAHILKITQTPQTPPRTFNFLARIGFLFQLQKLAAQHFVGGLFVADNFNAAHDDFVAGQRREDNAHIAGGVVYVGVKIHARQCITQILQVFAEGGGGGGCSFAAVNVAFALRGEIGKGLFRRFAAVLQNIFGHRIRNALADMNDDFYAFLVFAEPRFFFRHFKLEIAVFQIQGADALNVGVQARFGIAVVVGKEVEQAARFHFHQAAQRPVAENFVAFNVNIGHRHFRAFVHLKQNADAVAGQGRDDGVDFGVVEVAGGVDFLYAVCGFGEFAAVKDARARDAGFFQYLQHSFGVEFFQAGKCYFGDDRIFAHANHEHAAVAQYFHGFEMPGLVKFAQQRRGGVGRE